MLMQHHTLYGRPNGRVAPSVKPIALAQDRVEILSLKSIFKRAKKNEASYAARLRRVAKHISDIVREFPEGSLQAATFIRAAMERYSLLLEPWAQAVAGRMVAEIAQRDEQSWKQASAHIGRALRDEIASAPTGEAMRKLMAEQVMLIKSLPIEAGERVHKMTMEGISQGLRASEISARILETGDVTKSRADLIARTETARTASVLTQVRAEHIGSTHFIWRTAGDSDVRKTHKALNGKPFAWSDPPECDPGHRALPGQIWNCRCYAEPIIPE